MLLRRVSSEGCTRFAALFSLQRACGRGISPRIGSRSITTAVKAARERQGLRDVAELSRKVEDEILAGRKPPYGMYKALMANILKASSLKHGFELLEMLKTEGISPDSEIVAMMMMLLLKHKDELGVLRMYQGFIRTGSIPSANMFEAVGMLYKQKGDMNGFRHIFAHMRRFGVSPSAKFHTLFIETCAIRESPRLAEVNFESCLRSLRKDPPLALFNSMMKVYALSGESANFTRVYESLGLHNLKPDVTSMRYAMLSKAKANYFRSAQKLHRQFCNELPARRGEIHEAWLEICAGYAGDVEATQVYRQLPTTLGYRDVRHFNWALMACSRANASTMVRFYRSIDDEPFAPDSRTFSILARGFASRGFFDEVMRAVEEAERLKVELDPMAFKVPLIYAARKLEVKWSRVFLREMRKREIPADNHVRGAFAFASVLLGDVDRVLNDLERIPWQSSAAKSDEAFCAIISACAQCGDVAGMERAFNILRQASSIRNVVPKSCWNALVTGYRVAGNFAGIDTAVKQMREEGHKPGGEVLSCLLYASLKGRRFGQAADVAEEMVKHEYQVDEETFYLAQDMTGLGGGSEGGRLRIAASKLERTARYLYKKKDMRRTAVVDAGLFQRTTLDNIMVTRAQPKQEISRVHAEDPEAVIRSMSMYDMARIRPAVKALVREQALGD